MWENRKERAKKSLHVKTTWKCTHVRLERGRYLPTRYITAYYYSMMQAMVMGNRGRQGGKESAGKRIGTVQHLPRVHKFRLSGRRRCIPPRADMQIGSRSDRPRCIIDGALAFINEKRVYPRLVSLMGNFSLGTYIYKSPPLPYVKRAERNR